jgi:hypothetical protein
MYREGLMWRSRRDCGRLSHRSGASSSFYGSRSRQCTTVCGSYCRIGANGSDPVRRGGTGHEKSRKRPGMERSMSCHARESPEPLADGGIEDTATLPYRGGFGGRLAAYRRQRPLPTAGSGSTVPQCLTLGNITISLIAARRSRRDGARAENNFKEDCEDLRRRRPQGRLQEARGGLSPSGIPHHVADSVLHAFYSYTHRMWGSIGSRGSAADRSRRGGSLSQSLGVTSTYTGTLRKRCATLSR